MSDPRIRTTVEVNDGDAVIVRRATDPDARATLVHAADLAASLDHPGVEAVLTASSTSEATEVRVRAPGGRTLASTPPRDAVGAARVVAGVAQVLADLHELGVTHGPTRCGQVALAGGARPVLMDFSGGHRRSEVDEDRWEALVLDDVRGIGTMIDELLALLPSDTLGWSRERLARRRLGALAAHCHAATRGATVVAEEASDLAAGRRRWPWFLPAACAVVGLVALLCGIIGLLRPHGTAQAPPPAGPSIEVHGNSLVVDGSRFRLGRAGDLVELGDWDGDGVPTPALLRPSSGEVFVFEQWPAPEQPLTNPPVTVVAGAVSAHRRQSADGLDQLVITTHSGSPVPIDPDPQTNRGSHP